jgi:hypothetical protein
LLPNAQRVSGNWFKKPGIRGIIGYQQLKGCQLAKPNYQFEKRQKELAKKKKKEEKRLRKLAENAPPQDDSGTPPPPNHPPVEGETS